MPGAADLSPTVLAVDVGGTKMAAGVVGSDGAVLARSQVPTRASDGPELFSALVDVIAELGWEEHGPVACGVGCGGPMASSGELVSPVNIPVWRSFPLGRRLSEATGLETYVDNDAKALALAEGWLGAARGEEDFLAMVVSTGVGGGIVLDGRLLDGSDGNAGHIGHVIVEPGGRTCGCGARGCLEAEASGTAIRAITGRDPADAPPELVERVGMLVGRAVASVVNLLDLNLAVVAGSVALGYGVPFFDSAQRHMDRLCLLDHSVGASIVPAGLGADAPLVGAAAVAWRGLALAEGERWIA